MANDFFRFKEFTIYQQLCAMKVGTDGVLLGAWVNAANAQNILDIGTGTGLVAIMVAQKSQAIIDAIDIDNGAFAQATENIKLCQWKNNILLHQCAFQEFAEKTFQTYDIIITNPPYFDNSLKAPDAQRNLARHNDTLTFIDILQGVSKLLNEQGQFIIILPYIEAQLFIVEAAMRHLYCNKKLIVKTLPNKKPSRIIMEFSKNRIKLTEEAISIYNSENEYSDEYKNLTKNYYLKF